MPQNTTIGALGTPIDYQNPGTVDLVLDSEVQGPDATAGKQLTRELVVPVESINIENPLVALMTHCLVELKKIRILLEQDVPPELREDELDEGLLTDGQEEQISEGIEEE